MTNIVEAMTNNIIETIQGYQHWVNTPMTKTPTDYARHLEDVRNRELIEEIRAGIAVAIELDSLIEIRQVLEDLLKALAE